MVSQDQAGASDYVLLPANEDTIIQSYHTHPCFSASSLCAAHHHSMHGHGEHRLSTVWKWLWEQVVEHTCTYTVQQEPITANNVKTVNYSPVYTYP